MFKHVRIAIICASIGFTGKGLAQTLPLDASFGTGGVATMSNVPARYPVDMALQSDGKIVYLYSSSSYTYLMRTHANGSLDETFVGDPGYHLYPTHVPGAWQITGKLCAPLADIGLIRVLYDSKIMAVFNGYSILKFNTDGTLDTTFGNLTYAKGALDLNNGNPGHVINYAQDMYDAHEGGLYFVGRTGISGVPNLSDTLLLAKTTAVGIPDATYGLGGKKTIPLDTTKFGYYAMIQKAIFAPDGKILVTGVCQRPSLPGNGDDAFVARYNQNGTLDNTFGIMGVRHIEIGGLANEGWTLNTDNSGNIYVTGKNTNSSPKQVFITKLTSSGNIDVTFGTSGSAIHSYPAAMGESPLSTALTSYGKIYTSSLLGNTPTPRGEYMSWKADGTPNTAFGPDGSVYRDTFDASDKILMQPDNKLLIIGAIDGYPRIMRIHADALPTSVSGMTAAATQKMAWVAGANAYINTADKSTVVSAAVMAIDGRVIKKYGREELSANGDVLALPLPVDVASGVYVLTVYRTNDMQQVKFVR